MDNEELIKYWNSSFESRSGNYLRILQRCEMGTFPQFGSYIRKNGLDLQENFITNVSLDKEVMSLLNFGSRLDREFGLRIWTRFALVEVYSVWVLFLCTILDYIGVARDALGARAPPPGWRKIFLAKFTGASCKCTPGAVRAEFLF